MGKIDVMNTEVGYTLRAAKMLSESVVWYESLTPQVIREIIDKVRYEQLFERGIDSTGEVIGWYSQWTEVLSGGLKKFNEPYTLHDTGAFYEGMFVIVLADGFIIDSDGAEKEDDNLFEKYGENIVGLTDENLDWLKETLYPKYIAYTRRMLRID